MNKLIPMVLFFLEKGQKPRHEVTKKIKNYPKDLRADAIKYLMNEKLISLHECESSIGRKPVFIKLTEKGTERVKELSRAPRHNSIWGC